MPTHKYDIFISYRRGGGAQYARTLQLMLEKYGYRIFLDYDELRDGPFSPKIEAAIKEAPIYMIVLSKDSMTLCANEGDWVRKEIEIAVREGKRIIPVNPDNTFDGIPDNVPSLIKEAIGGTQYSEINFGQTLNATVDLMVKNRIKPYIYHSSLNNEKPRIFISYKRKDKDKVFRIKDRIEKETGEKCWIDLDGIESDAQFKKVIFNAIINCDIFLFMYSNAHSRITNFENDWTVRELNFAKIKHKRIVFVNLDGSPLTDIFLFDYGRKQQFDTRSDENVVRLITDLKEWLKISNFSQTQGYRDNNYVEHKCEITEIEYYDKTHNADENTDEIYLNNNPEKDTEKHNSNIQSILRNNSNSRSSNPTSHQKDLNTAKKYDAFISYSTKDKFPTKACAFLEEKGVKCWIAPRNITPGTSYARAIMNGIQNAGIFLVFISANSLESEDVLNEIDNAKEFGKTIVPIFIENVELTDEFRYYLKRKQWISTSDHMLSEILSLFKKNN